MFEQATLILTLAVTLTLFVWERWRYDIVAILCLLFLTVIGIVPPGDAFSGFGHPAVITVAAVLIASKGLQNAGVVNLLVGLMSHIRPNLTIQLLVLVILTAITSAFMNNIGALAVLMPVAIQVARNNKHSPSLYLMPLAFASLLGGMITVIGTPPNIIIATFREEALGQSFAMFDFSPVGGGIALVGGLFLGLVGWRFLPMRKGQADQEQWFAIENYITELRVKKESTVVDQFILDLEDLTEEDIAVVGIVRKSKRLYTLSKYETLKVGDILIVEADPDALKEILDKTGLELMTDKTLGKEMIGTDEIHLLEAVVAPNTRLVGKTARNLRLRGRYGVNLLAVARQGARLKQRFNDIRLRVGDVLLMRGAEPNLQEAVNAYGCLPLATREMRLGNKQSLFFSIALFVVALTTAAIQFLPIQIAFSVAAVGMILYGLVPVRDIYRSIDWPIIILLGAMLPVGRALESTGVAQLIAGELILVGNMLSPAMLVGFVLIITMFLSDLVNNAAAAVLMAPIAVRVAVGTGCSIDPFLMAVAIGASCAFLTPIGHQSNALVMGPGGYRFGDYWKLGLPLEILIVILSTPLILYFWPV